MANFADVFKRKEMKYLLSADQRQVMERDSSATMEVDAYGRARVTSLYYDTPERLLIERSLDKPLYKEKLRVRWYGNIHEDGFPDPQTQVFVELKKKFKGIVYKRRLSCSFAAAQAFLAGEGYLSALNAYPLADPEVQDAAYAPKSLQIASEIRAFMDRSGDLQPSMLITCERTALTPRLALGETHDVSVQDEVRLTFDENIQFRDVAANSPVWCSITEPGQAVMEIKLAGSYPRWLLDAVSHAEARPSSFSKYGQAYTKVQTEARDQSRQRECTWAVAQRTPQAKPSSSRTCTVSKAPVHGVLHNLRTWIQTAAHKKEKHYV